MEVNVKYKDNEVNERGVSLKRKRREEEAMSGEAGNEGKSRGNEAEMKCVDGKEIGHEEGRWERRGNEEDRRKEMKNMKRT